MTGQARPFSKKGDLYSRSIDRTSIRSCSCNNLIKDKLRQSISREYDNQTNNTRINPFLGFPDLFVITTGSHPKETNVNNNHHCYDTKQTQSRTNNTSNGYPDILCT